MSKSNKKAKENPVMVDKKKSKKAKNLVKNINNTNEEENLIRNFIILVIVIAIIIGLVFLASELLQKDNKKSTTSNDIAGEINYNKVSVGTLLNRPEKDYYVLVYNSDQKEAVKYGTLFSTYIKKNTEKDYIPAYYCDLSQDMNKEYYNVGNDNKSNPKAKEIKDFDFGDITLLHIKKGKITEYIEDYKTIQEKLK